MFRLISKLPLKRHGVSVRETVCKQALLYILYKEPTRRNFCSIVY